MDRVERIEEVARNTLQPCKTIGDILSAIIDNVDDSERLKNLISFAKNTDIIAKNNESIEKVINIVKNLENSK